MKTKERLIMERIVKMFPGNTGVNFDTTTDEALLLLIEDSVKACRVIR